MVALHGERLVFEASVSLLARRRVAAAIPRYRTSNANRTDLDTGFRVYSRPCRRSRQAKLHHLPRRALARQERMVRRLVSRFSFPASRLGVSSLTLHNHIPLSAHRHWVPPSRLRPIATSRIAKTLGEADSALATLQAQNHTAQADPYLSLDPAKKALAEGLAKKVKEAEQSVQAWRMIQGAQADVEGEGAWLDRGRALDEWKEERKKLQAAGGRGEEEEGSPGSGYKSEGRESAEIGSPLTPATEHEVSRGSAGGIPKSSR